MNFKKLSFCVAILFAAAAHATPETDALSDRLTKSMPGLKIEAISPSPIPGLYEIVSGGDVAYVTADGVYMVQGTLFNVPERRNLSEKTLGVERAKAMKNLDPSTLVIYPAKGKEMHVITVFTDPSCPYCHKLHSDLAQLNDMGITVRYALYARSGTGTLTSRQLSEVLCANDKKAALERFFANSHLNATGAECKQAAGLERINKAANQVGLKGTPHIVSDSGYSASGYMSAPELLRTLQQGS